VKKSGAWYTYGEEQLGQGRENAKQFLVDNPKVSNAIEAELRGKLNLPKAPTPIEPQEIEPVKKGN